MVRAGTLYVVPRSALPTDAEWEHLVAFARGRFAFAHPGGPPSLLRG